MQYTSVVIKGSQLGRSIGFPTLNLYNPEILNGKEHGVYASKVKIGDMVYGGALYLGPRLVFNEQKTVLEIYVFDFDREIYGETISFDVLDYVRPVISFQGMEDLKTQLKEDCDKIRRLLKYDLKPS